MPAWRGKIVITHPKMQDNDIDARGRVRPTQLLRTQDDAFAGEHAFIDERGQKGLDASAIAEPGGLAFFVSNYTGNNVPTPTTVVVELLF